VILKCSPIILSEEARTLKRDFKVAAIISRVNFTTVPHHRIGEIDFIGLKENREIIIIEVKNKQAKLNEKDRLQLEYYIDGLPKQYHYTKFYPHLYEVMSQLYPEKYRTHMKLARSIDLLREVVEYSYYIVENAIMELNYTERKKFISMYPGSGNNKVEYEDIEPSPASEEIDSENIQLSESIEKFLTEIPEYVKLEETFNTYNSKLSSSIEEFKLAGDLIVELMEKGVKNGLLVDIRRSEVTEVDKTTNFDKLVKGVWRIKKSVFDDKKIALKKTEACSRCNFRNACKKVLKDEEPEECKSITSIAHKGFEDLNLEVRKPGLGGLFFDENGMPKINYIPAIVKTEFSIEELLKHVLDGTEWKYIPILARKQGWKQLYADAIASNKLEKEFSFWRL
jgi:hypothetical protein